MSVREKTVAEKEMYRVRDLEANKNAGKATPGPWVADITDPNIFIRQKGVMSFPVAYVGRMHHESEAEANARLLAAAPQMYAVLENVASYLESFKDQWLEGDELLYCGVTGALNKVTRGYSI